MQGLSSCIVKINGPTQVTATFGTNIRNLRLDIDQSGGNVEPLTDGMLIIRYLFGVSGDPLIAGAVTAGATRSSRKGDHRLPRRHPSGA